MDLGRRVASGTSQLILSHVGARMLSLLTIPVLTSLLTPQAYGVAALVVSSMAIMSALSLVGADVSYTRAYQNSEEFDSQAVETFVWRYALAAGAAGGSAALLGWMLLYDVLAVPRYLGIFVGLGIFASVVHSLAVARARLRARYRALSLHTFLAAVASAVVSVAIAALWRQDEFALVVAVIVTWLLPVVMLGTPGVRRLAQSSGLTPSGRRAVFGIGFATVFTAPAFWVMASSDRWFLSYFGSNEDVGVYAVGYTFAILGMMLNNAILPVWTTEAIREHENEHQQDTPSLGTVAEKIVAGLLVAWLAVASSGGDLIRLLAASEFHAATAVIPYISAAVFFHGVSHLAMSVFTIARALRQTIKWWLVGVTISVVLNALVIPHYGILGAAMVQAVTFFVLAAGLTINATQFHDWGLRWSKLGGFVALTLAAVVVMSPAWSDAPILSLVLKIPFGIFFAGFTAWLFDVDVLTLKQLAKRGSP